MMTEWQSFFLFLSEARQTPEDQRQQLVDKLLRQRTTWPWVQGNSATFIYINMGVRNVALNLDTINEDPPFAQMVNLEGTTLWYIEREFASDDLLDYLLAVDDPMTPLAEETDIVGRISRHWRVDSLNPLQMYTSQMNVSVLQMPDARPFPDWKRMSRVPRGRVTEHPIDSKQLGFSDRRVWVYTPPDYDNNPDKEYPLLILQDGQWAVGPLQIPQMADALIKHNRMQPIVIAMTQSGNQQDRIKTYVSNDKHYRFVLTELLPAIQAEYRIDPTNMGIGGVAVGAIAAAHTALKNPAVFSHLLMISPPMGKGIAQDKLLEYTKRFESAPVLPKRIFHSVGRYEARGRFYLPAKLLDQILSKRVDVAHQFVEIGSGHGLVGFRSIFTEALAWVFPAEVGLG